MNQLIVINQSSNNLSYMSGQVTVSPNGQSSINFGLIPYLILDPNFKNDVLVKNIYLSDSVNIYVANDALDFLSTWLQRGPPQNANDPVIFTLAGKGFSVTGDAKLSATSETPVLLLQNPPSSLLNARAIYFYAAPNSTQGIVTINIYINPTVTNAGTPIPIVNNLITSNAPASSMLAYGAPSVNANGTKRITIVTNSNADTSLFNFAQTAILGPNNSILMTVTLSNLGLLASVDTFFYLQWVEV